MLTCHELADFLLAFIEGELPEPQAREFETHVELCPPCKHYLESYRETVRLGRWACSETDELPSDVPLELVQAILAARRQSGS